MTERTDGELLELAAKAAGKNLEHWKWEDGVVPWFWKWPRSPQDDLACWNPLEDDGDALRLAVKLDMIVTVNRVDGRTEVACGYSNDDLVSIREPHGGHIYAATRRAIVRAAAAMAEGGEHG